MNKKKDIRQSKIIAIVTSIILSVVVASGFFLVETLKRAAIFSYYSLFSPANIIIYIFSVIALGIVFYFLIVGKHTK